MSPASCSTEDRMQAIRMIYFSVQGTASARHSTLNSVRRPWVWWVGAGLERLAVKETGGEDWTDVAGVSMANESWYSLSAARFVPSLLFALKIYTRVSRTCVTVTELPHWLSGQGNQRTFQCRMLTWWRGVTSPHHTSISSACKTHIITLSWRELTQINRAIFRTLTSHHRPNICLLLSLHILNGSSHHITSHQLTSSIPPINTDLPGSYHRITHTKQNKWEKETFSICVPLYTICRTKPFVYWR